MALAYDRCVELLNAMTASAVEIADDWDTTWANPAPHSFLVVADRGQAVVYLWNDDLLEELVEHGILLSEGYGGVKEPAMTASACPPAAPASQDRRQPRRRRR